MTINVIVSSVLFAVQKSIKMRRDAADDILSASIDWNDETRAILSGIPASFEIDLANYLTSKKGYNDGDIPIAGNAIAVMEPGSGLIEALANGGDLSDYTSNTNPDDEIVQYIIGKLNISAPKQGETMNAQTNTPSITIDPGMENAINALLSQATKGQLKDLLLS